MLVGFIEDKPRDLNKMHYTFTGALEKTRRMLPRPWTRSKWRSWTTIMNHFSRFSAGIPISSMLKVAVNFQVNDSWFAIDCHVTKSLSLFFVNLSTCNIIQCIFSKIAVSIKQRKWFYMLYYSLQILSGIEGNIDYISPQFKGRNIDHAKLHRKCSYLTSFIIAT